MPYFRLDGLDITADIELSGCKWSENDLDAPKSGRTLDGVMQRQKVAEKKKAEIKLKRLKAARLNQILPILRQQYFTVTTDMFPGSGNVSLSMYNSTRSGMVAIIDTDGKVCYDDTSFNVIER